MEVTIKNVVFWEEGRVTLVRTNTSEERSASTLTNIPEDGITFRCW
jgi:hypothetical protein